jgi:hypothetical protein
MTYIYRLNESRFIFNQKGLFLSESCISLKDIITEKVI